MKRTLENQWLVAGAVVSGLTLVELQEIAEESIAESYSLDHEAFEADAKQFADLIAEQGGFRE